VVTVADINECNYVPRPCTGTCTNTAGTYNCSCDNSEIVTDDGNCTGKGLYMFLVYPN